MTRLKIAAGTLSAVYSDDLVKFLRRVTARLGLPESALNVSRVSRIDPRPDTGGLWQVDFRPSGGPVYTHDGDGLPFQTYGAALEFELRLLHGGNHAGTEQAGGGNNPHR